MEVEETRKVLKYLKEKYPDEFRSITGLDIDDDPDDYTDEYDGYFERNEPYVRAEPKIGRNDPCPCGSGKNIRNAAESNAGLKLLDEVEYRYT